MLQNNTIVYYSTIIHYDNVQSAYVIVSCYMLRRYDDAGRTHGVGTVMEFGRAALVKLCGTAVAGTVSCLEAQGTEGGARSPRRAGWHLSCRGRPICKTCLSIRFASEESGDRSKGT